MNDLEKEMRKSKRLADFSLGFSIVVFLFTVFCELILPHLV